MKKNLPPNDKLRFYLERISTYPLLTPEEEKIIAQKAYQGDKKSREKLILSNLRFVVKIAKEYQNQGLEMDDLIAEGNLGLLKAAERFDPSLGFKFISYAVWWIRQSILYALRQKNKLITTPDYYQNTLKRMIKQENLLAQRKQSRPTLQEVMKKFKYQQKTLERIIIASRKPRSLNAPLTLSREDSSKLEEVIPDTRYSPESYLEEQFNRELIESLLQHLTEREKMIIKYYFGLEGESLTLKEIAQRYNLSRERIRQIKKKALEKLQRRAKMELQ